MSGRRAALVLAGGYSTRFGDADKAFAELDGRPLLDHVVTRLDRCVDGVVVNCRSDQVPRVREALRGAHRVACAPDPVPDRGPVAGVAAGLRACRTEYTAVVAVDNPLVSPAVVTDLFERARGRDGAVPVVDGRLRPTQAVYRTERMQAACTDALDGGESSLRAATSRLDAVTVAGDALGDADGARSFLDVNTPADLERAAERDD